MTVISGPDDSRQGKHGDIGPSAFLAPETNVWSPAKRCRVHLVRLKSTCKSEDRCVPSENVNVISGSVEYCRLILL